MMKLAYLELNRIGHSKCANLCCSVATLSNIVGTILPLLKKYILG